MKSVFRWLTTLGPGMGQRGVNMRKQLLYLILILSLVSLGIGAAVYYGLLGIIIAADITKLTLGIAAIYMWFSGEQVISAFKDDNSKYDRYEFVSEILVGLGLTGTVIGLIIATGGPIAAAISNPTLIKSVLAAMSSGVGTALYSTGAGIITSMLLRIQNNAIRGNKKKC
jgi:hypothetical protein